jgi:hypothetical protein
MYQLLLVGIEFYTSSISLVDRVSSSAKANSDQAGHISCHWGHPLLKKLHIFGAVVRGILLGDSLPFFGCVLYVFSSHILAVAKAFQIWKLLCVGQPSAY